VVVGKRQFPVAHKLQELAINTEADDDFCSTVRITPISGITRIGEFNAIADMFVGVEEYAVTVLVTAFVVLVVQNNSHELRELHSAPAQYFLHVHLRCF
jgi:hypothetical protein